MSGTPEQAVLSLIDWFSNQSMSITFSSLGGATVRSLAWSRMVEAFTWLVTFYKFLSFKVVVIIKVNLSFCY